MKNLNRDEKKYINDKVRDRVNIALEKYSSVGIQKMIEKEVLKNLCIKDAIKFLETLFPKDFVNKKIEINKSWKDKAYFKFNTEDVSLEIFVTLPLKILNEINKSNRLNDILGNLKYNPQQLKFEQYYILFSTWAAPNSERLDKINELVELICKDLEI